MCCCLKRVEHVIRFVQIDSDDRNDENLDAHANVEVKHKLRCGETDQRIAALLTDLKQRDLLEDKIVIWPGEFGGCPPLRVMMAGIVILKPSAPGWPVGA